MTDTISTLAAKLRPHWLRDVGASGGGIVSSGGGGLVAHALNGAYHTGELDPSQAPWALTDAELAAHAADPDAHHARQHNITSASDHTVTGSAWQVVGLTGANALGLLTPSADVRSGTVETLLKSDSSGGLGVKGLTIGAAMTLAGTNNIATAPDIQFASNGLLAAESSLYFGVDSTNTGTGFGFIFGHNASTSAFTEIARLNDTGNFRFASGVATPTISTAANGLTVTPATDLLLQPGGDLVLDPTGNDVLPATNYDINLGAINRKYLTIWAAELWVETLVAQDTIATIGGRILVGPTTTLTRDLAAGATTVYVKHNQMSNGDVVYMEAAGKVEFMRITSAATTVGAGEYSYTVGRNLDGSGQNDWFAGDAMFNTGQVGNGFIDLYSLSGIPRSGQSGQRAGPTIVGNVRTATGYNSFRERWAIGKLNALYDYSNDEFGAAFGDPTAAWIGMDATNGVRVMAATAKRLQMDMAGNLRLYDSAGTATIALDNDGSSYFANVMTIGTGGEIRQGSGAWGTNWTGLRIWRDGAIGRIGGYKTSVLQWSADTDGVLRAGAGAVEMGASGYRVNMDTYDTAGTRAIKWSPAGDATPRFSVVAGYDTGDGSVTAGLVLRPVTSNAATDLYIATYKKETLPYAYGNIYMLAALVDVSPGTLRANLVNAGGVTPTGSSVDIGTAGNPFRALYVQNIVADTITGGTALGGSVWQHDAGDMYVRSSSSAARTLYVANPGAGTMHLDVEGNILLGGTVDGVDLSSFKAAYDSHIVAYAVHIGNANAHHSQAHAYDSSADHTGTLSWSNVNKTGSALADLATRPHSALTGIGANDHHNQQHAITGSDHTVTGSALDLVGLSGANTLGILTPSSNPGSTSAILRTNAGALTIRQLTVSLDLFVDGTLDLGTNTLYEDATYLQVAGAKPVRFAQNIGNANWTVYNAGGADFRGNVQVLAGADLSVAGSGSYAGAQVLFADSSGGNVGVMCVPDPQFALDVAGPARAQYFVGPHAIQLKDALLIAHYDGPERAHYGDPNGHAGQVAVITGDVVHRLGKFNKAIEITDSYTNIVSNPGLETNTTGWEDYSTGTATGSRTRTNDDAWAGYYSYHIEKTGGANADRFGVRVPYAVTNGQAYALSVRVKVTGVTNGSGAIFVARTETLVVDTQVTVSAADGEWQELILRTTGDGTGTSYFTMWLQNCDAGTVYIDAAQVTATYAVRPFWGSVPARTAGSLTYAALDVTWSRLSVMTWFRTEDTASALGRKLRLFELYQSSSNRIVVFVDESDNTLRAAHVRAGTTANIISTTAVTARAWNHAAVTVTGRTVTLYLNGVSVATATVAANITAGAATAYVGSYSGGEPLNGMIDDFAIVNRALTAGDILSVYQSNAPVFAETSVWSWRVTPRGLVWADSEGLWAKDTQGNPVLGVYGGEAATKSWAGWGDMAPGDIIFGFNAIGSSALRWTKATGKWGFFGAGNLTPQVEIGTDGSILAGAGAVRINVDGLRAYTAGNTLGVKVDDDGIFLAGGGARTTPWSPATASRIRWGMGELFEAASESYLDSFSNTRYTRPTVLRSYWDGGETHAAYLELAAASLDLSTKARIIVADGYWLPENYSNPAFYNTTNVIDLQTNLLLLSATNIRMNGPATSAAAVGTYAGKIKININGTDRWIPYYAS